MSQSSLFSRSSHDSQPSSALVAFRRRRLRARGFTLVELLTAMLAGAFVSLAAFAFAKAATTSFQEESRMSNATLSSTLGFRRLVSDVQRAAYMSSPNIQRDYRRPTVGDDADPGTVCVDPAAYPLGIRELAGVVIEKSGYDITGTKTPVNTDNLTAPDRITLAGNFASSEQFWTRRIVNGTDVYLEPNSGPVVRTSKQLATSAGTWETIFKAGRILRVIDQGGFQHYGVIASTTVSNGQPMVRLTNETKLFQQGIGAVGATNPSCTGIAGFGEGTLVNVISRIRYEVRDLRNVPAYASLYGDTNFGVTTTAANISGDDDRHELVRYEIDATDGAPIAGTVELVAEYAVDLRFGGTVATDVANGATAVQTLKRYTPSAAGIDAFYTYARKPTLTPTQPGPERVRGVQVRLAVRSRLPDRDTALLAPAGSLFRFKLANGKYARVRSLQAEVALNNQLGVFW
jgi:prepilin-type N-terminal cleavage/methylation domain-containing protein